MVDHDAVELAQIKSRSSTKIARPSSRSSGSSSRSSSVRGSTVRSKNGGDSPFGEFVLGVILICFALPLVWMNERKQVKIYQTIVRAEKAVIQKC